MRSSLAVVFALVSFSPSLLRAAERRVAVPRGTLGAVSVACPVGQATRIIFPEPLRRLKGLGVARSALGLDVEQAAPFAVLVVRPPSHPARGSIEFQGTTLEVRLDLTTLAQGQGGGPLDVVVVVEEDGGETGPRATEPSAETIEADAGHAQEAATTPAAKPPDDPSSRASDALDLAALLTAEPIRIDRREGLPGQPEMRLTDALRAERWVFFRLRLEKGAKTDIRRISWEDGDVRTFARERRGDDLLIVVQLPRERVSRRTRIVVETETGVVYHVATHAPTFPGRLRDLFR